MRTFADKQRVLDEPESLFWFDCVVVDEHASQSYPPEWWETAFSDAVGSIGNTCLMMTPWSRPGLATGFLFSTKTAQ